LILVVEGMLKQLSFRCSKNKKINKRAQRAMGRSPEEKVKGHSGANNREPVKL